MRLRRYLLHQKTIKAKEGNLLLANEVLEKMGLKSLLKLKEEFDSSLKGRRFSSQKKIKSKKSQKTINNWSKKKENNWLEMRNEANYYQRKLILSQLKETTNSLKKLEKGLARICSFLDAKR